MTVSNEIEVNTSSAPPFVKCYFEMIQIPEDPLYVHQNVPNLPNTTPPVIEKKIPFYVVEERMSTKYRHKIRMLRQTNSRLLQRLNVMTDKVRQLNNKVLHPDVEIQTGRKRNKSAILPNNNKQRLRCVDCSKLVVKQTPKVISKKIIYRLQKNKSSKT